MGYQTGLFSEAEKWTVMTALTSTSSPEIRTIAQKFSILCEKSLILWDLNYQTFRYSPRLSHYDRELWRKSKSSSSIFHKIMRFLWMWEHWNYLSWWADQGVFQTFLPTAKIEEDENEYRNVWKFREDWKIGEAASNVSPYAYWWG